MGKKIDPYGTYGKKLLHLFASLLFSGKAYSLTELARMLECSKSSVLRLLSDIQMGYPAQIEEEMRGKRKYVWVKRPAKDFLPPSLTQSEWQVLQMCRAFTEHLLGRRLFAEATQALLKSRELVNGKDGASLQHAACFRPGTIDYTAHHQTIHTLIEAMEAKKICLVEYRALMGKKAKSFYIMPFKLFSHHDTVYLHARKARAPGSKYRAPEFDPILPVHRIQQVEMTDRGFEWPRNYDFDKLFNRNFGVMKEDAFTVEAEFTGWAARYVSERIWSPDQKIEKTGKDSIRLTFTAASKAELIGWLLYFGEEAKLLKPVWLVEAVAERTKKMAALYS